MTLKSCDISEKCVQISVRSYNTNHIPYHFKSLTVRRTNIKPNFYRIHVWFVILSSTVKAVNVTVGYTEHSQVSM
jgi:hypothetical protein